MMRRFLLRLEDSTHQIMMLWPSQCLFFLLAQNVLSESMHQASLIEMDQFVKETRTDKDILNFENYESVLKDFESFPIVSSTEKNSSWCEVTGS